MRFQTLFILPGTSYLTRLSFFSAGTLLETLANPSSLSWSPTSPSLSLSSRNSIAKPGRRNDAIENSSSLLLHHRMEPSGTVSDPNSLPTRREPKLPSSPIHLSPSSTNIFLPQTRKPTSLLSFQSPRLSHHPHPSTAVDLLTPIPPSSSSTHLSTSPRTIAPLSLTQHSLPSSTPSPASSSSTIYLPFRPWRC